MDENFEIRNLTINKADIIFPGETDINKEVTILGIQGQSGTIFKLNDGGEITLEFDGVYELNTHDIGIGGLKKIEIVNVPAGSEVAVTMVIEGGNYQ